MSGERHEKSPREGTGALWGVLNWGSGATHSRTCTFETTSRIDCGLDLGDRGHLRTQTGQIPHSPGLIVAETTDATDITSNDVTLDLSGFPITRPVTHLLQPLRDRLGVPLLDDRWIYIEVAVTDPGGPHAPVHEARPSLTGGPVGEMFKIVGLHFGQLRL
jgi:hypothetical protein